MNDIESESMEFGLGDQFLLHYRDEAPKRTVDLLRDLLLRVVTLSPTLAGFVALFFREPVTFHLNIFAAVFFLAAFVISALGVIPVTKENLYSPHDVRCFLIGRRKTMKGYLLASAFALMGGLITLFVHLIALAVSHQTHT